MPVRNARYDQLHDDDTDGIELRFRHTTAGPMTPDANLSMSDKMDAGRPSSPISYRERDTTELHRNSSIALSSRLLAPTASNSTVNPKSTHHSRFEKPDRLLLGIHTISCLLTYPFLFGIARLAQNMSLFLVRVYVGLGCAVVGVAIGYSLVGFAKKVMQAAIWATLIHQSDAPTQARMSLHELSSVAEDTSSPTAALWLMYYRRRALGVGSASKRRMDHRIWTFYILFFIVLICTAAGLSFIFGRLVAIDIQPSFDMSQYTEVPIFGDITRDDQNLYYTQSGNFRLDNWENLPVAWNNTLPSYVAAPLLPNSGINTTEPQMIYFPEAYPEQLRTDGFGIGAANTGMMEQASRLRTTGPAAQRNEMKMFNQEEEGGGQLLQFARWGTRSVCTKLDNMNDTNNFSFNRTEDTVLVHIRTASIEGLFARLGISVPERLEDMVRNGLYFYHADRTPLLLSWPNDTALVPGTFFSVNATFSSPTGSIIKADWIIDDGNGTFTGWLFMGMVVIRARQQLAPNGTFGFIDATRMENVICYDAAICLDVVEPWVLEVFNSTRGPTSTRILGRGVSLDDVPRVGKAMNSLGVEQWDLGRNLNSSDKYYPFRQIHSQSNRAWTLLSDMLHSVSNILISWTDGTGPWGYTTLSPDRLANFRSVNLATRGLPLLSGSRQLVARSYPSVTLASARIENIPMAATIAGLFVLGLVAGLCVPALPQGKPRRGVDLISWIAALEGDGLQIERNGEKAGKGGWELECGEEVEEVNKDYGEGKVRYPID